MDQASLNALIDNLLSNTLTDEETIALNEALQHDAEARAQYLDRMRLEDALHQHYAGAVPILLEQPHAISRPGRLKKNSWKIAVLAAAACVMLALVLVPYFRQSDVQVLTKSELSETRAWLEYRDGMEISSMDTARPPGLALGNQRLKIDRGQAAIRFKSGALLMLDGPAEIAITGTNAAELFSGSATVRIVEGGEGFQLKTPQGLVTDLGTEFGVRVNKNEADEVHVIDGKVRIETPEKSPALEYEAGQTAQMGKSQKSSVLFMPEAFSAVFPHSALLGRTVWLDQLGVDHIRQGTGKPQLNLSVSGADLSVNGVLFRRGIGTHSPSEAIYKIPEGTVKFRALVGIADECIGQSWRGKQAACIFKVIGDGKTLWESPVMRAGDDAVRVDVPLEGVQELRLAVENGPDGDSYDHANWLEASFIYTGETPSAKIWTPDYHSSILTPPAGPKPRINGPKVVSGTPGKPFLFRIPTTGNRPIRFAADGLPAGLTLDTENGIISGKVPPEGDYPISIHAENALGSTTRELRIVSGDTLALTPPMGWNSWQCWSEAVTAKKIKTTADSLVKSGLADHGWSFVNIDDCWQGERGGPLNAIQGNSRFPDMRALASHIHAHGLKIGIYSTPWISSPAGFIGGSSPSPSGEASHLYIAPHDRQQPDQVFGRYPNYKRLGLDKTGVHWLNDRDTRQWAEWGIDYAKFAWTDVDADTCKRIHDDLKSSHRDMVFSIAPRVAQDQMAGVSATANLWRVSNSRDHWQSVTRMMNNTSWASQVRPGHWADLDTLQLGLFGTVNNYTRTLNPTKLGPQEQYSHMTFHCLMSAPLILSCDIENMSAFTLSLLTNSEVIDINQDPLGKPAAPVENHNGVWLKPLENGDYALGIFNLENEKRSITTTLSSLGLPEGNWQARDLWRQKDLGKFGPRFTTDVERHGVILLRLAQKQDP